MQMPEENNESFGIEFVKMHAESSGNIASRLHWFETFAVHSELYQLIAKPLMSMRTVGSDNNANVLYRARENVNHIMKAKKIKTIIGKSTTDSIN